MADRIMLIIDGLYINAPCSAAEAATAAVALADELVAGSVEAADSSPGKGA